MTGGNKIVGSMPTGTKTAVDMNSEIPKGVICYVDSGILYDPFFSDYVKMSSSTWDSLMAGDMSHFTNDIESRIAGSKVIGVRLSWTDVNFDLYPLIGVAVKGFRIEAWVKNVSAGLTGLEIVAVIGVIAFLIAVIAVVAIITWTSYTIVETFGGAGAIFVFIVAVIVLLLLFGVKFGGKKGKGTAGSFKVGK